VHREGKSKFAQFPLRPLRTKRDLDRATRIVNELAVRGNLSRGEQDYLDVVTDMVDPYERTHHPIPDLLSPETLRQLLEERGLSQAEAAGARFVSKASVAAQEFVSVREWVGREDEVA
jgi:antitoxin component HigA of HigAB toxin-antitoxin module